jgi:hypothetical protein
MNKFSIPKALLGAAVGRVLPGCVFSPSAESDLLDVRLLSQIGYFFSGNSIYHDKGAVENGSALAYD